MNILIITAAVLLLIIGIVYIYVATRKSPPAMAIPTSPCDSCVPPQVCVNGACDDVALPGLLSNAQNAARGLHSGLVETANLINSMVYYAPGSLSNIATSLLNSSIPPPSQAAVLGSASKATAQISSYIDKMLIKPGCVACGSTSCPSCGYYSDIVALNTKSAQASFYTAASEASSIPVMMMNVTSQISTFADDLKAYLSTVEAFTKIAIITPFQNVTPAAPLQYAHQNLITLNKTIPYLNSLATLVKETGYELYSHFV